MSLFGTNDKAALTVMVVAVVVLVGALVGLLARRWYGIAIAVILGFVGVGLLASLRLVGSSTTLVLVSAARAGGARGLRPRRADELRAVRRPRRRPRPPGQRRAPVVPRPGRRPGRPRRHRRRPGTADARGPCCPGRRGQRGDPARPSTRSRRPAPDASFAIDGLTPLVVPNDAVLPHRHGADHPCGRASTAGRCGYSAWSTRRSRSRSTT